jgi:hypothetical protein
MKSNLLVAKAFGIKTSKKGFNIQNVQVLGEKPITCAIPSSFVPYSEFGKVTDKFGDEHLLQSNKNGHYYSKTGIITQATSNVMEIPEDTMLVGFLRKPNEHYNFMRFIPIVALLGNKQEYVLYDFVSGTYNEVYSKELMQSIIENDYDLIKALVIRDYSGKFNRVYKNTTLSDKWLSKEDLEKIGICDLTNWEIKLI